MLFYFRWLRIPALWVLIFWLALQAIGVIRQMAGFSQVSYLAHLGGAAVGVAFWLGSLHAAGRLAAAGERVLRDDQSRDLRSEKENKDFYKREKW